MGVIFIINNFWRFWYDIETWWSMASYVFFMLGLLSTNPLYFHNLKCFRKRIILLQKNARAKWTRIHFFGSYESSHDTNSIFLQAKNAQRRTNSNCGKLNVSKNGSPIFYKRKRYTNILFNKMFFQRMGASALRLRGPSGPTPIFWKNILLKRTFVYRLRL